MSEKGTIFSRLVIIAFAASVVALGAHELHKEYERRYAGVRPARNSIDALHGSNVIERAQMRSSSFSSPKARQESVSQTDRKELQSLIDTVSK